MRRLKQCPDCCASDFVASPHQRQILRTSSLLDSTIYILSELFSGKYFVPLHDQVTRVREAVQRRLFPVPFPVRHACYSMVFSEDDAASVPSRRLLDTAIAAIQCARRLELNQI